MARKRQDSDSNWISFSDLMTGLMVVFMFIAISYIIRVYEYEYVSTEIYNSIKKDFSEEIKEKEIDLSNDGTVRFNTKRKGEDLFKSGGDRLSPKFKNLLNNFIPRYLNIVTDSSYLDNIKEIRIEGHADNSNFTSCTNLRKKERELCNYKMNLELSSRRAQKVLIFLKDHKSYKALPTETKMRLDFLFTANGMSFSRTLNEKKELSYLSIDKKVSMSQSRRVEFRVVTSSEKLIQEGQNLNSDE